MSQISLTFPDGNKRSYPAGVTPAEVAASIAPSLAKASISAMVNGKHWDLQWPIHADATISLNTMKDDAPALELIRTRFDGRIADDGALRRDRQTVPEVELLWWPGKWRVEAEAKYIFFTSNESAREREGYRLTLSVGYLF